MRRNSANLVRITAVLPAATAQTLTYPVKEGS
jgi:hypothetical protein